MTEVADWTHLAQIDPEFEKLLQTLPAPPSISDTVRDGIPALRTRLAAVKRDMNAKLLGDAHLDEISILDTAVAARDGYQIPVRIYKPISATHSPPPISPNDGSGGGHPLVILLHGGGFCLGGLDNEELLSRKLAAALKCVVVNVDYRLAPEHPFPAAVNDAWDVVKWAATTPNDPLSTADPTAGFIVGGVSAGANLSAVVGTLARDLPLSPPLTGLLLSVPPVLNAYDPPAAHAGSLRSFEQNAAAPVLDRAAVDAFFDAYAPDRDSPLFNLYSERQPPVVSRAGLPPVYVQVCGLDPLRDEALLFEHELRTEHGTPTKLQLYPGLPHSFWSFFPQLQASKKWIRDTLEGVEWLLDTGRKETS
ncbi:ab hydrolase superfamily protein [Diplodia corticola]|uniref:Ab hydrolase superfamily protein n=1 Tax=Diplodia corticola TaxID=236234 RepID=A0A1J9R1F8_9PEZI|nr:ab hydrolase superfamily protein [Diplodia corticola]OJD34456.1 ab hydrolase superfamily protein [Diplodia corticola]